MEEKKRLAIINARGRFFSQYFLEGYDKAGIEYDFSTDLEEFLEEHKNLNEYRGILIHPPLGFHEEWLNLVQKAYPDARIAFATTNLASAIQEIKVKDDIPLLDFYNLTSIRKYFDME
jgi:hypothetical protein